MRCRALSLAVAVSCLFLAGERCLTADTGSDDALAAIFATNAARGFGEAQHRFDTARRAGDYDAMLSVVRTVGPWAQWCWAPAAFEPMALAMVGAAEGRGRWQDAGDVQLARALICFSRWYFSYHPVQDIPRGLYLCNQALACYAKAGVSPPDLTSWVRANPETSRIGRDKRDRKWDLATYVAEVQSWKPAAQTPVFPPRTGNADDWYAAAMKESPENWRQAMEAACEAKRTCDDAAAIGALLPVVDEGLRDPTSLGDYQLWMLTGMVPQFTYLQGGELLASRLHPFAEEVLRRGGVGWGTGVCSEYAICLARAWTGGNDVFLREIRWFIGSLARCDPDPTASIFLCDAGHCAMKMWRLGLLRDSADVLGVCLAVAPRLGAASQDDWSAWAACAAVPDQPASLREALMDATLQFSVRTQKTYGLVRAAQRAVESAAHPRYAWLLPLAGQWLVDAAEQIPDGKSGASVVLEAADMFERGGQTEQAARCRDLAKALAAGDPKAALQCALTSARSLATHGKWDEVVKGLQPAVAAAPDSSPDVLQAAMLLAEAHLRLGKPADAEPWMTKAKSLIGTVSLSPAEKANYLMTLAELCDPRGPAD